MDTASVFGVDTHMHLPYSQPMEKFKRGLPGLKKIRTLRKLSQNGLAQILGLTSTHVYRLETGRSNASQRLLAALSEKLECTVDQLINETPEAA